MARSALRQLRSSRGVGGRVRALAVVLALAAFWPGHRCQAQAAAKADEAASAGERIYREGVLPSGRPLQGRRENQTDVQGAAAACVNCHRRSGLGTIEGPYLAPPVTAKYLRRSAQVNATDLGMAHVEGYHPHREAYTDDTLARALRQGVSSDGAALSPLMPRYDLDPAAMKDLLTYLGQLGSGRIPGVSETALQFATIITPDADPVERDAMLAVIERFFANQSEVIAAETRPMKTSREIRYRVTRQWKLHVWQLGGAPETWGGQLRDRMAVEPVFAVISGLGRAQWQPVHDFCESERVPCLFPNVDLPVVREKDFYPAYFSRGVLLEADLMADWLGHAQAQAPGAKRLIQVFRRGDAGAAAASALAKALPPGSWRPVERALAQGAGAQDIATALADVRSADVLVLWLRGKDLQALPAQASPASDILVSGLLAGLEAAPLPDNWRARVHMSYPVDLPERRLARMNFPFGWLKVQGIPITAERVQVDTYLACVITAETLGHMFDSFVPEYLLERLEMMVSRRLANAYFPRLGLSPGQRFASKGGYIVHFDEHSTPVALPATADSATSRGIRVVADTDWNVP